MGRQLLARIVPRTAMMLAACLSQRACEKHGADLQAARAQLQSPIADPIGVPFQNNVNFNYGPLKMVSKSH
jgi:hypothetical protein